MFCSNKVKKKRRKKYIVLYCRQFIEEEMAHCFVKKNVTFCTDLFIMDSLVQKKGIQTKQLESFQGKVKTNNCCEMTTTVATISNSLKRHLAEDRIKKKKKEGWKEGKKKKTSTEFRF